MCARLKPGTLLDQRPPQDASGCGAHRPPGWWSGGLLTTWWSFLTLAGVVWKPAVDRGSLGAHTANAVCAQRKVA